MGGVVKREHPDPVSGADCGHESAEHPWGASALGVAATTLRALRSLEEMRYVRS